MTEFVYKDYLPLNARVIVNYKAHERVKFSYPLKMSYWEAVWKNAYQTITIFWIHLNVILAFYSAIYILTPFLILRGIFFPITIKATESYVMNFMNMLFQIILPIIGAFIYLFGIPAIFTFILARDKEKLSKWIPRIGYWGAFISFRTKYKIFTKKDVMDKKVIIPSFSNVYLHYDCNGDFDKFLDKVEIIEIPFKYETRSMLLPFIKKTEDNSFEFRAVFYFSGNPINGSMKVSFV